MWVNVCAMHVSFPADSTDVVLMLMLLVSHPIQQRNTLIKQFHYFLSVLFFIVFKEHLETHGCKM